MSTAKEVLKLKQFFVIRAMFVSLLKLVTEFINMIFLFLFVNFI